MGSDPEWRFDATTGRRVLISPNRGERPLHIGRACPFCEGHESETPNEVLAFADGDGARTRRDGECASCRIGTRRCVLDFSPLRLGEGGRGGEVCPTNAPNPFPQQERGIGVAEVFLECPHHETKFRELDAQQIAIVLRAWRDRLRFWRTDGRLAFAQVFKNEGPKAGASVEHCHSQLIGAPFVPEQIQRESFREGVCPFCVDTDATRIVSQSENYEVICPIAPRVAGETWIVPKLHEPRFEDLADDRLPELAATLKDLLTRVSAFNDPDLNIIVRTAPFAFDGDFHWRLEILPRTVAFAGWELATGLIINTIMPERAASLLRDSLRNRLP